MGLFNKKNKAPPGFGVLDAAPMSGTAKRNPRQQTTIPGYKGRTVNLLCELKREPDAYRAIELITTAHPDASQAVASYLRLANNGFEMEFYSPDGTQDTSINEAWREFAAQPIDNNMRGLDGLIDQIHDSEIRFGGIGVEVVVAPRSRKIAGIYPVLPQWLTWELDKKGVWHAYQQNGVKRVEVTGPNFFWVAMDNDVGSPVGRLMLEPSLMAIERQLQFFDDLAAVLRQAGYPRNDLAISREAVLAGAPASVKANPQELKKYCDNVYSDIVSKLRAMEPEDALVHWDDMAWNKAQGVNSRTIDARSYLEIIDPQVMNGLSTPALMLNRTTGSTETWGTVQFKIMVQSISNIQRGSKRLMCYFQKSIFGKTQTYCSKPCRRLGKACS